jgi:thiamine biosynthesis lipoprotein
MLRISRRRFLAISSSALAGMTAAQVRAAGATVWRGVAMGAPASIILRHPEADRLIAESLAEINRLENIFSLYRGGSALSRLNEQGFLLDPPFEMLELLGLCRTIHTASGGLFDVTVQPLWETYAAAYAKGHAPSEAEIAAALEVTGWGGVSIASDRIALATSGMALTFNGIAQGYVADRVAGLLQREGVSDVLVNTGEFMALGESPDGGAWPVLLDAGGKLLSEPVPLQDMALASSAPRGTAFDAEGRVGHILDPRSGLANRADWQLISVTSPSAALADALTTAMCLMDRGGIDRLLAQMPDARLVALV